MASITDILNTVENKIHGGLEINERVTNKMYGIFYNPVFLITFFGLLFLIVIYNIYHYYMNKNPDNCYKFSNMNTCPDYCVWDAEDNECITKVDKSNVCPDYWTASKNKKNIICTDNNNVAFDTSCYSNKENKEIEINNQGRILFNENGEKSHSQNKCNWMKKCGSWEGQSQGRFDCEPNQISISRNCSSYYPNNYPKKSC